MEPSNFAMSGRTFRAYVLLLTLHTALLVASNAAGAKMIAVPGGLAASATVGSYMGTFIILTIIADKFGRQYSKLAINVGLIALAISVAFFQLAIITPAAEFWKNQGAFEAVLGASARILAGGWLAYFVAQHLDVWGFFKIKTTEFGKRALWLRALGAMAIGQAIDTVIFMTVAFYGEFPILPAILGQYALKVVIAIIAIPIVYVGVHLVDRYIGEPSE